MTDGRVFPQEAAASMLALRGWSVTAPAHSGWEPPTAESPDGPSLLDTQAVNLLYNSGWAVSPPPSEWRPAFTPQFYEAGGDQQGQVYMRIDLPERLYYAFQDAAREGLNDLKVRREKFEALERKVSEFENNRAESQPRDIGLLDGIDLTSMEIRSMICFLTDQISLWEQAQARADTRRHPKPR